MKTLSLLLCLAAGGAAAQESLPPLEAVLDEIDGANISASGYVGRPDGLDLIYFIMKDGRRFRTEFAVDRATLEQIESCRLGYDVPTGCAADITGSVRLKDDYFQVLVDSVANLRPVE